MRDKVCYIWDEDLIEQCSRLPAVCGRATMVHDLIMSYELNKYMKVVRSSPASYEDLKKYHSELYIDYLKSLKDIDDEYVVNAQDEEYGMGYDCQPVSNMFELVSAVAGGSITAAKCLVLGMADVAINWCGGWHHAQRFGADGFCYVNDIVLAMETLKIKFSKILYIDLDVHHGNGVQYAYNFSKTVFTLSFHKYEPGFYPGTGSIDDLGSVTGTGYSCNFPLHAWYSDGTMEYIFEKVFTAVCDQFVPEAIVVQCGADALARDPHGGACLTTRGYCTSVETVLRRCLPTLLLGGGGYNFANTSRLWTRITADVVGVSLDENIPEHQHWTKYGPDYTLSVQSTLVKDINKKQYLDECITQIKENLRRHVVRTDQTGPVLKKQKVYDNKSISNKHLNNCDSNSTKTLRNNSRECVQSSNKQDCKEHSLDVYDFID